MPVERDLQCLPRGDADQLALRQLPFYLHPRDHAVAHAGQGQPDTTDAPPNYVEEYLQWDLSVNYAVNDNLTVFFEGINLTNETERSFGRFERQFLSAAQYGPRYAIGVRYTMGN